MSLLQISLDNKKGNGDRRPPQAVPDDNRLIYAKADLAMRLLPIVSSFAERHVANPPNLNALSKKAVSDSLKAFCQAFNYVFGGYDIRAWRLANGKSVLEYSYSHGWEDFPQGGISALSNFSLNHSEGQCEAVACLKDRKIFYHGKLADNYYLRLHPGDYEFIAGIDPKTGNPIITHGIMGSIAGHAIFIIGNRRAYGQPLSFFDNLGWGHDALISLLSEITLATSKLALPSESYSSTALAKYSLQSFVEGAIKEIKRLHQRGGESVQPQGNGAPAESMQNTTNFRIDGSISRSGIYFEPERFEKLQEVLVALFDRAGYHMKQINISYEPRSSEKGLQGVLFISDPLAANPGPKAEKYQIDTSANSPLPYRELWNIESRLNENNCMLHAEMTEGRKWLYAIDFSQTRDRLPNRQLASPLPP